MPAERICRFKENTRVLANVVPGNALVPGTIVKTNHYEPAYRQDALVPYKIALDDGRNVFAPLDHDSCVQAMPRPCAFTGMPCLQQSQAEPGKFHAPRPKIWSMTMRPDLSGAHIAVLILQYKEDILNQYMGILEEFAESPTAPYMASATLEQLKKSMVNMSRFMFTFEEDKQLIGTVKSCMEEVFDVNGDMFKLHQFMSRQDKDVGYEGSDLAEFYENRVCTYGDHGLYQALAVLLQKMEESEADTEA